VATDISADICVRFGKRVRSLREAHDWSITYLSVHSGLAKTFVHDVETGKKEPCLRTIEVFAKSFDLTVAQLMKGL
jgi:transcriptional regulator with XRE-family HTH domain